MKKNILILSLLCLNACGTVFSGSVQTLTFDSNVKNVKLYANGELICSQMPCTANIARSSAPLTLIAKSAGYEDTIQQIRSQINTASWGNLISAYSWTTDFATSSMWQYSRDGIYINMQRSGSNYVQNKQFKKDSKVRHFALFNFGELRLESVQDKEGEFVTALSSLTGKNPIKLKTVIYESQNEVALAHKLTGIN